MDEARDAQGGCGRASGAGEAVEADGAWRKGPRKEGGQREAKRREAQESDGRKDGTRGERPEIKVAESGGKLEPRMSGPWRRGTRRVDQESMTMAGTLRLGLRLCRFRLRRGLLSERHDGALRFLRPRDLSLRAFLRLAEGRVD